MADSKLSALTEVSVPELEDLLYIVEDPAGTPTSRKVTTSRMMGFLNRHLCEGRLTLKSGNGLYVDTQSLTPSSTNTGTDVVTFSADHNWNTGQVIWVTTAGNGLSHQIYYLNCPSTTTASFHTTAADAIAGTSKVNLTGSVTSAIVSRGLAGANVYFALWNGNRIALYDGTRWKLYQFTELTLALSGLTAATNYDVFVYDNAGTLTLETTAWTNDTTRATALTTQDGIYVKTGATTRRYLGTFRATGTTTTEDSERRRLLINYNNVESRRAYSLVSASHSANTASAWRAWNNDTSDLSRSQTEFIIPVTDLNVFGSFNGDISPNAGIDGRLGVDLDGTTSNRLSLGALRLAPTTADSAYLHGTVFRPVSIGYHYAQVVELSTGASVTWSFVALALEING